MQVNPQATGQSILPPPPVSGIRPPKIPQTSSSPVAVDMTRSPVQLSITDAHIRHQVLGFPVDPQPLSLWPPSDGAILKTCRGGSKATVEICESPSTGIKYAKKYVSPMLKQNEAEWKLEQGRLENDLKTYQQLGNMRLGSTFGGLYHYTRSEDEGLVLYLEYAGSLFGGLGR